MDQLEDDGKTWLNYMHDGPWESQIEKINNSVDKVVPMRQFYADVKNGKLPSFSWVNPRSGVDLNSGEGSNCMHPNQDVRLAEKVS